MTKLYLSPEEQNLCLAAKLDLCRFREVVLGAQIDRKFAQRCSPVEIYPLSAEHNYYVEMINILEAQNERTKKLAS